MKDYVPIGETVTLTLSDNEDILEDFEFKIRELDESLVPRINIDPDDLQVCIWDVFQAFQAKLKLKTKPILGPNSLNTSLVCQSYFYLTLFRL